MLDPATATAAHYVLQWSRAAPERPACVFDRTVVSYAALAWHVANAAQRLAAEGLGRGDVAGLACESAYVRIVLSLACEALGAVELPLAAADLTPGGPALGRCGLILAERPPAALGLAAPVVAVAGLVESFAAPPSPEALARLAADHGAESGVRIARTSGTTGAPKHVLKTRRMLNAAVATYDASLRPVAGDYTYLCHYSPAVNGVYTDVVRALRFGNTIRFVADLDQFVAAARPGRTYAFLLTQEAEALAGRARALGRSLDMHYVDVTGAGLAPELDAELRRWVSPWPANVYSSNETSVVAYRQADGLYAIPPQVDVRILDEAGHPLPAGEVGRIAVRSPMTAQAYLWDEALTRAHFRDGWFLMSDLGRIAPGGRLAVRGRIDDMVEVGGRKISPYPIEQALKAVPGVADAALLQAANPAGVGMMCVAIEPQPGEDPGGLGPRVVNAMPRSAGAFKLEFLPQFPRTPTGKVQRARLAEMIGARG